MTEYFDNKKSFRPIWQPSSDTPIEQQYNTLPPAGEVVDYHSADHNLRQERRIDVEIRALISEIGSGKYETWVCDLSRTGFRIEMLSALDTTRPLMITLPGLMPLRVHMAWHRGDQFGLTFDRPLHVAVFDYLTRRFRH